MARKKTRRCKFGRSKSTGRCLKSKRTGKTTSRRRGAFAKGRKRNIVGKKATGSGRFCMMTRSPSGKASSRCYASQDAMVNALDRLYNSSSKFKSVMLYSKKAA